MIVGAFTARWQFFRWWICIFILTVCQKRRDVPVDMNAVTYTDNTDQYTDFEEGGHYLD